MAGCRPLVEIVGEHFDSMAERARDKVEVVLHNNVADVRDFEQTLDRPAWISRGHNAIWVGWDESAAILARCGMMMDALFIPRPLFQHGSLNGSALPVKFASRQGETIDCYEQPVQFSDDGLCFDKLLQPAMDVAEFCGVTRRTIDDRADKYHGVYHCCLHSVLAADEDEREWIEFLVKHLKARDFLFFGTTEWLQFNDARRSVVITDLVADGGTVSFRASSDEPIDGLTFLLPPVHGGAPAQEVTINSTMVKPEIVQLEGRSQIGVAMSARPHEPANISVRYHHDET